MLASVFYVIIQVLLVKMLTVYDFNNVLTRNVKNVLTMMLKCEIMQLIKDEREVNSMNERQTQIIEALEKHGEIEIHNLAEMMNVSDMTIYRDVSFLEQQGFLYRKRGAAVFIEKVDIPKQDPYYQQKQTIARCAAALIQQGDTVILDNSTTALEVARLLNELKDITVYTTSLEAANILCKNRDITLYCSGGYYLHASTGFVGSWTETFLDRVRASKCIVGASGISVEFGITGPYPPHSSLEKKIMSASEYVIMVADHSKLGKVAMEKIAEINEIDCLITDAGANEDMIKKLQAQTKVVIAKEE